MHSRQVLTILFSLLFTLTGAYDFSTASLCTTKRNTKSVSPVPTSSYVLTVYKTYAKTVTSTPTSIITPPATTTTTTTTATATTTVSTTSTLTTTTTTTYTDTLTSSTTTTTTVTEISSTQGTSTVPTSAGFTPVASGSNYVPKKRSSPAIRGRSINPRAGAPIQLSLGKGTVVYKPQVYPVAVTCGALVVAKTTTTKTVTASKTTTITVPTPTKTSTVTTTTTSTSVVRAPDATTTVTQSTTTTATTTETYTATTTTTQTVVLPSATVYAACQSNNVVGSANGGQGIANINYDGQTYTLNSVPGPNAVACCENCQQVANCAASVYTGGTCYTFVTNSCNPSSSSAGLNYETSSGYGPDVGRISNGPCGQFSNGGSLG